MAYGIVATQGVAAGGGGGSNAALLADVSNAVAVAASKKVSLTWADPDDVTYGGTVLAGWVGTTIVRKEGSAPTSRTDGTIVLTSTTKNAYSVTPWVDTGLTNGTTYFYRFFPQSSNGNYTESVAVSGKPAPATVQIPTITSGHTYTGSAQSPTLSNFDDTFMEKTGDVTKTDVGTYSITIRLMDDDHIWSDGSYTDKVLPWVMEPESLDVPTVDGTLTYTGSSQPPTLNNFVEGKMTKSSDTSKTDAGNYTMRINLTSTNYVFNGENSDVRYIDVPWSIEKAAGVITLSKGNTTLLNIDSDTATITKVGDGTLSVSSSNASLVTGSINGTTLTVTKAGNTNGTVTITVSSSATTNYTAGSAQIVVTVQIPRVMTVKIDTSNSNPETCCTYADDAVNMTAGSDDWDAFFGHYPCLMSGGVEGVKLNPNNFDEDINGNAVTIDSGNNDVMIAFPRHGLKISTSGNIITVSMTEKTSDSNFKYYAHQRGSTDKDKFYIGAYSGSEVSSKLRSLKGQAIAVNKTIGAFRTLARANSPASNGSGGSGYDQWGWYQLIYLQAMYCLKYKNLNSQAVVGAGYSSASAQLATGGTETWGMDKKNGTVSGNREHMKIFGIEDFWANCWEWVDGMFCDANRNILTGTQGFNDTGSGYTNRGQAATANQNWSWLTKVMGTTEAGFTPVSTSGGSETTYWCDYSALLASCLPFFGGYWSDGSRCGVFCLNVSLSASTAYSYLGSRLMYL